ncbi:MAG TPA: alkaline phosphatase family protein, partial [Silvibacterium sp.]|nr:alkaline phosphatase family protein [Silvibacterium sp.]
VEKSIGKTGGYLDATGTPSPVLFTEIKFVDASIAAFVRRLKANGLYDSTLIVITAKHGQNPIDPTRYNPILKQTSPVAGSSPATLLDAAGYIPYSESPSNPTGIGPTEDDVSLVWLKSSSDTEDAVKILEENPDAIGLGQIYYGTSLSLNFNDPTVDPRTPDIITVPNVGVVYTGSTKKLAEHGGFNHDDTNVMLLLSNSSFKPKTIRASVGTAQVAPTILQSLGISPWYLDAVRKEGVSVLPAVQ